MRFAKPLLAAFALGSMIALPAHAELDVASLKQSIETSFESEYPKLDALYKDIHAHPEIAFQEEKTAAKLAAEMRAIGFEVTEKVGKTGLVALYKNGDGPTIMVRTELDALPMEEKTAPALRKPRQDHLAGARNLCHPQLRPRHPHGELGRNGEDAGRSEGPVEGHADVHRPARRGSGCGCESHAGRRPVHALSQARCRLCAA